MPALSAGEADCLRRMVMDTFAVSLQCHPQFPAAGIESLQVQGRLAHGLHLEYRLEGHLASLCLPRPGQQLEPDRLWAHSCCELFLARDGERAYREYNFSPSGQWAGYGFSDYRERISGLSLPAPEMRWRQDARCLSLDVDLPMAALPPGDGELCLALTMVLQLADGSLSYWALQHPPGQPDFHHRAGFALRPGPG